MSLEVDKVLKQIDDALLKSLETSCKLIESEAKIYAPVRTGKLKNSISHSIEKETKTGTVYSDVKYAPYVEAGTSKQKAQPFLQRAVDKNRKEILELFEDIL